MSKLHQNSGHGAQILTRVSRVQNSDQECPSSDTMACSGNSGWVATKASKFWSDRRPNPDTAATTWCSRRHDSVRDPIRMDSAVEHNHSPWFRAVVGWGAMSCDGASTSAIWFSQAQSVRTSALCGLQARRENLHDLWFSVWQARFNLAVMPAR